MPGGALRYLDCKKGAKTKNCVKDLDVYSFYADDPEIPWPYRRHVAAGFGESVDDIEHSPPNVRAIFDGFRMADLIADLVNSDRLYLIVKEFAAVEFAPEGALWPRRRLFGTCGGLHPRSMNRLKTWSAE